MLLEIPAHFPNILLNSQILMPNHLHGIIIITDAPAKGRVGAGLPRPYEVKRPTLGQIVGFFKYQSTKHLNKIFHTPGSPLWQRNYYEHVIRNEDDLEEIRGYIENNPAKWLEDENHPDNILKDRRDPAPLSTQRQS